ncbi:hypothetical protein D6855_00285 [Butyrivibrio sp. CB08]|uniref:DUF6323 family protein n=1 Tax=Butyrivibrio sp. CB08 TaxID=2364879 RepID=UPI000EAAC17D|nr:DUF6323 family protein [Butyrivibrio sp. CB08]RKM61891.1 hypothetical protein D6855_00285 [Butyrivibrio sp. CB08]
MDNNYLQKLTDQYQINQILKTNDDSREHGLTLTEADAAALAVARRDTLQSERRVEFGEGIMPKLIRTFCDSTFIDQDDYQETLSRLQDIFYLYKNESMDMVTDDELLAMMKRAFEEESGGDLEYLEGTALEDFARRVRAGENWADRYKRDKLNLEDSDEF